MIGLPGETDEDVMGIAETIAWLQQEVREGKWHLAVNVTIRCARQLCSVRQAAVLGAFGSRVRCVRQLCPDILPRFNMTCGVLGVLPVNRAGTRLSTPSSTATRPVATGYKPSRF